MPSEFRDGSPLDGSAARELDDQYRDRLCRLVEREMNRRFRRREDPEDVVQSAFRTFYRRNARGEFRIDSSADLWRLLATIARHKMLKHVERLGTAKRDPKREEYPEGDDVPGRTPTPEQAAIAADLIEKTVDGLDEGYVAVFHLRLQGHTEEEIAAKMDCTRATVRTRLGRIRERLERFAGKTDDRQPVEPAGALRRCLETPVGEYLEAGSPPGGGEEVGADASMTLEGLFRTACPPPELLAAVKRRARRMMYPGGSGLPVEVQQVVYFGSIAAATVRRGERISKSDPEALRVAFQRLSVETRLDGWLRELFAEALRRL
jgi:RNA polymerase sigma-70 factor (ECF subfamily)